jgi:hypothetical protein
MTNARLILTVLAATLPLPGVTQARGVTLERADRWAARTYVTDPSGRVNFQAVGRRVVTADGSTITAVGTLRRQSADGTGEVVLFFRGGAFLGWASAYESLRLALSAAGTRIVVRYAAYTGNDPFCCPSGTKRVVYRWNGSRITASDTRPLAFGRRGQRLHLAPA